MRPAALGGGYAQTPVRGDPGMVNDGLVPRKRLFDLLSTSHPVRVVAAPSGFGKTTLVRTWIDARWDDRRSLAWVALSAEVPTRRDFWQLVAATAARPGEPADGDHAVLAGEIDAGDDPVEPIARLVEGRGQVLLVVDGCEHLRNQTAAIGEDIVRLVTGVADVEVVITTRAVAPLNLEIFEMRGLVHVIDASELRFTTEEAEELMRRHAPHAVDVAERVVRDTRGYPLAVRAAAHALARSGRTPAPDEQAWQRLVTTDLRSKIADPALAEFVIETSVTPFFDDELARELSGADDVDRVLAELEWNGFGRWIPHAGERSVFQYVESVRAVFSAWLRGVRPKRAERNAGLAAAWLHRHGDNDQAVALAIDARQYGLVSRICRTMVHSNPHFYMTDTLERQLRRVPRAQMLQYPGLAFILGMSYSTNPATQGSAAEYLRLASRQAPGDLEQRTSREKFSEYVRREVSLRYLGRGREAGAVALDGIAFFDSMSATERDGLGEFAVMALSLFAYSAFQAGEVDRASAAVDRAATLARSAWWKNYALGFALAIHGINGHHRVARAAESAIDGEVPLPDQIRRSPHVLGALGIAALSLDRFEFTAVLDQLESAVPQTEADDTWPFITWVAMHARLGLGEAGAEAHRVEAALATTPRIGVGANLGTAAVVNALAILWLADGRPAQSSSLLRTATACPGQLAPAKVLFQLATGDPALALRDIVGRLAEPGHTIRSTAAVETLGAAAARRAGNDEAALALLEQAASKYRLFDVRAHLLYLSAPDLAALRELAEVRHSESCTAYLAGGLVTPIAAAGTAAVQLTRREIEALRVWATHRTRAEVASALFVSANTVKSQLQSAYRKLGVSTKDEAIQRAIELGLLHPPRP